MSNKSRKKNAAKKQKEKVVYYDDNSTIFDMSGVNASRRRGSAAANETPVRTTIRTAKRKAQRSRKSGKLT